MAPRPGEAVALRLPLADWSSIKVRTLRGVLSALAGAKRPKA